MKPYTKLDSNIALFRPLLDVKKEFLIKISKNVFGKYFRDPSNINKKYLRTKIRKLKKPLLESGINYDQIIKSIKNLASSKETLENHFSDIFVKMVKIRNKKILINVRKFNLLNNELKMNVINKSIKILKKNYYNLRAKKVNNIIQKLESKEFVKTSLAKCLFYLEKDNLCIKVEKNREN